MEEDKKNTTPVSNPEAQSVESSKQDVEKEAEVKIVAQPIMGIDFGNSSICVALATPDQEFFPKVIQNNLSNNQTPNVVLLRGRNVQLERKLKISLFLTPKERYLLSRDFLEGRHQTNQLNLILNIYLSLQKKALMDRFLSKYLMDLAHPNIHHSRLQR